MTTAMTIGERPPFIISTDDVKENVGQYPNSQEPLGHVRRIGQAAGLRRIGVSIVVVPPGRRISWPHAEENEEEFVYVLEGGVDAWIDGVLHPMRSGDFAAFPAGTGICHTFINNGDREARLLVGGEADKSDNRIFYPRNPDRRADMPSSNWWHDIPLRPQGDHDGLPDAMRRIREPAAEPTQPATRVKAVETVSLREATPDDEAQLLPSMQAFNRDEDIDVEPARLRDALRTLLSDASLGRVWFIDVAGQQVGYTVLTFGYDLEFAGRDAFITELYLVPEARGRGIGSRALIAIEDAARALDVHAIHLMVRPENEPAARLYRAHGYQSPPRVFLSHRLR